MKTEQQENVNVPDRVAGALEKAGYSVEADEFRAKDLRRPKGTHEAWWGAGRSNRTSDPMFDGDEVQEDFKWLWAFEYEGEPLSEKDISDVISVLRGGKNTMQCGKGGRKKVVPTVHPYLSKPAMAALAHATKEYRVKYHLNVNSVVRELATIMTANLGDFMEITEQGVKLKDTSGLDRVKFAAIQEVVEIATPHGRQVRIKLYDKMAAVALAAKLLDMAPPERKEIAISGLEGRLAEALARKDAYRDAIEGEIVEDENDG